MLRGDARSDSIGNFGNENHGIIGDRNRVGKLNSENTINSHNTSGSIGGDFRGSTIRTGDGGANGRGGDFASHNNIDNDRNNRHKNPKFDDPFMKTNGAPYIGPSRPGYPAHTSSVPGGGNLNVTINDFAGSNSEKAAKAVNDLQRFLTSDNDKNLVLFLGQPPVTAPVPLSIDSYRDSVSLLRGFPKGLFRIRASGSSLYWSLMGQNDEDRVKDGNPIRLEQVKGAAGGQCFYINSVGALCSQDGGGLSVDVIGNALVTIHNRPITLPWPNPWSHPPPKWAYNHETKQISTELLIDPLVTLAWPRPDRHWRGKEFVVSAQCSNDVSLPKFDLISQWAPNASYASQWTDHWDEHGFPTQRDKLGIEEKGQISSMYQSKTFWEIELVG